MKQMHITETVLRDAQQSLIATRMPFEDFEGILDEMDQAGYHSIECWGMATCFARFTFPSMSLSSHPPLAP